MNQLTIQDLFVRPISRAINGVIKADQMDPDSVWQELDEFVVTREMRDRLGDFFDGYLRVLDNPTDPALAGAIGVWVSGFFGSGKSHMLKVLAHLLRNAEHKHDGQSRRAIDFFEAKIEDAILLGDIKRAISPSTEVILFNIDSKANAEDGRDAILKVFLKVLNELQGYSPDHPHIAHMERFLDEKGKLTAFHEAFEKAAGSPWGDERDAYEFHRDQVVEAFVAATKQSVDSASKWVDNSATNFSLSVEKFAQWVRDYLERCGPEHRLLFFVDEIGQFIGNDTHLMLSLQTITENLGTVCGGRAWVVVTSQEDIDAVIGEVKTSKVNDFSKIQGRFRTKLSLSSSNVDEVIQSRLLEKTEDAHDALADIWKNKEDILRHQVALPHTGPFVKSYDTQADFICNYPFIPYQFKLLQKVFEAIRKVGASGQHLARGERSILDACQVACRQIEASSLGELVPLWRFYPAIEGFLDTAVAKTISNAADTPTLKPFDLHLLKGLFLIRYVEEIRGTIDNLVSLCLEEIDQDRLALKAQITAALERLEKESLIKRTGDQYSFLTNEERDITREIKQVDLNPGEEHAYLARLLFDDTLRQMRRHRHHENLIDFDFNRVSDSRPHGSQRDDALRLHVVSALSDDHTAYDKSRCLLESQQEHGQVLVVMPGNDRLARELRACLQAETYLRRKDDGSGGESVKRILRGVAADNQERKLQLIAGLADDFAASSWYVAGQVFDPKGAGPEAQVGSAMDLLIDSTFNKRSLLAKVLDEPSCKQEMQSVLRSNDTDKQIQLLTLEGSNPKAIAELRTYIELSDSKHQAIIVDALFKRFSGRPYAWPELNTALLLARLLVAGEISLLKDSGPLPIDKAYDALVTSAQRKVVTIKKRKTANPAAIRRAQKLGRELFGQNFSEDEIPLFEELRGRFRDWETKLKEYRPLSETGRYPGRDLIAQTLDALAPLTNDEDSARFFERLNTDADAISDTVEAMDELADFYDHQKGVWERMLGALERFEQNHYELEADTAAAAALLALRETRTAASPYQLLKGVEKHIATIQEVNERLLDQAKEAASKAIQSNLAVLDRDLNDAALDPATADSCRLPLKQLAERVASEKVLAQLSQIPDRAGTALDAALAAMQRAIEARKPAKPDPAKPQAPAPRPTTTVRVADLAGPSLIETDEQADALADKLRDQLKQAIADGKRVQIR